MILFSKVLYQFVAYPSRLWTFLVLLINLCYVSPSYFSHFCLYIEVYYCEFNLCSMITNKVLNTTSFNYYSFGVLQWIASLSASRFTNELSVFSLFIWSSFVYYIWFFCLSYILPYAILCPFTLFSGIFWGIKHHNSNVVKFNNFFLYE